MLSPDSAPWWFALPLGLYIAAFLLLEDNQRRGRHYFSKLMKYIGVDHA